VKQTLHNIVVLVLIVQKQPLLIFLYIGKAGKHNDNEMLSIPYFQV